jgi:hypothetical protein
VRQDRCIRGLGGLERWLLIFGISLISLCLGNFLQRHVLVRQRAEPLDLAGVHLDSSRRASSTTEWPARLKPVVG